MNNTTSDTILLQLNALLKTKQKLILQNLCFIATPLWLIWIIFDYLFASESFKLIAIIRILGAISNLTIGILVLKKKFNTSVLQFIFFLTFHVSISIMFMIIDIKSYSAYFIGYSMILIIVFMLLIIDLRQFIYYILTTLLFYSMLLIVSKYDTVSIFGNGGFMYLTVLSVMVFIGFLSNKRYVSEARAIVISEYNKKIIEEKNNEITDSINYAYHLQMAILPSNEELQNNIKDGFVFFKPKDVVSGDFYWYIVKNEKIFIAVADCTGHGVPGAIVSVVCNNALNRSVQEHNIISPNLILDKSKEIIVETFERSGKNINDGMDISICCFSLKDNILKWAGANNPLWHIPNGTNNIVSIQADKFPVGKYFTEKKFTEHTININKGDIFYMFSDGFSDQFGGPNRKKFMSKRLKQLLESICHLNMSEQKEELYNALIKWQGNNKQIDDICVIGIKI